MPVRQTLKTRTLFNLIGPLVNPARPNIQLLACITICYNRWPNHSVLALSELWSYMALALMSLLYTARRKLLSYVITNLPIHYHRDFGLNEAPLSELLGGDADFNATHKRILAGQTRAKTMLLH